MQPIKACLAMALLSTSLSSPSVAQTKIFGDYGAPAWSRMYKYFESRFGEVAKEDKVLILPVATNAAWDDPINVLRLVEMKDWGESVPSFAWQYSPNTGKRISEGYQYFLNAAWVATVEANGTLTESVKTALKRASEEVDFTRAELVAIEKEAKRAFDEYVQDTPRPERLSRTDFYKRYGWSKEIDTRADRLNQALATVEVVTKNVNDPDIQLLKRAQLKFNNPKQRVLLPPTRALLNDPDRWQEYPVTVIDKDIFSFLKEQRPQFQAISESSSVSDYFEQRWQASVSVKFLGFFRAGGASAEQVKREEHIRNNATSLAISISNIDTFNVVRGEWFDESVVSRFATKLKPDHYNAMWGANGQLELIPKTLLVARGMSFTIYADTQSLDYLYEHFHASADAGIWIGWFRVGGEGDFSTTKSSTKVDRYNDRIVFTDLSGRGKVLGVLAKHYASIVQRPPFKPDVSPLSIKEALSKVSEAWNEAQPISALPVLKTLDPAAAKNVLGTK